MTRPQALADESWAIAGVRSPAHWLTMRVGLSPFHARQIVAVAARCGELPTVMAQFVDGQLSLDQVSVVARYVPAQVEASVAELAVHASVPQLRRALSRYSFDPPAENGHTQQQTTRDSEAQDTETADSAAQDTEAGGSGDGDAASGEAVPGDGHVADAPSWNGLGLKEDRARHRSTSAAHNASFPPAPAVG